MLRLIVAGLAMTLLAVSPSLGAKEKETDCVLQFEVKNIDGKPVELETFEGDVLLIVNTASKCGLTPQYEALEELYREYKDQAFKVLAFPANQFGGQEPGTNEEIKQFCSQNYDVSFPLFSKIVVKGKGIHPLYSYLTSEQTNGELAGEIAWNFTKFLVNRDGEVIARFEPRVTPDSEEVTSAIKSALTSPKSE